MIIMTSSFNRIEVLTVVIGAHDLRNIENSDRFDVKSYIPHPDYIDRRNQNDIMLMRVTNCNTFICSIRI